MNRQQKQTEGKPDAQLTSFIKWAGGKGQLLPQFLPFFPTSLRGRGYIEPFLGSGAVFLFVIQNLNPRSCTLLDVNPDLINTWQVVRDNVEALITRLSVHKSQHNAPGITDEARKLYYYGVRAEETATPVERAARFIYLNKTCFNGLHRQNSKGKFNVPMGNYREPRIFDASHLRNISRLLAHVTIESCSFQECEAHIADGDFAYFDPPYEPLSRTSNFTSYAKDAFTSTHQEQLRDLLQRLATRADWMLSNSTAPLIEALYAPSHFHKHRVLASRLINSNSSGRGKIEELLITSYPRTNGKLSLVTPKLQKQNVEEFA